MMECAATGCGQEASRRGLCTKHYKRFMRHGSTDGGGSFRNVCMKWLTDHADHSSDECLIWPFARTARGYGTIRVKGSETTASRQMTILAHGDPPSPTHQAAHRCGNGHLGCVNPKHLRWLTCSENNLEKHEHGTMQVGPTHWRRLIGARA